MRQNKILSQVIQLSYTMHWDIKGVTYAVFRVTRHSPVSKASNSHRALTNLHFI